MMAGLRGYLGGIHRMVEKATDEVENQLDMDWVELIQEAINIGLTVNEIREYFSKNKS